MNANEYPKLPRTTAQLLRGAGRDQDRASVWVLGEDLRSCEGAIIVVKGVHSTRYLHDWLVRQRLLTPGREIPMDAKEAKEKTA